LTGVKSRARRRAFTARMGTRTLRRIGAGSAIVAGAPRMWLSPATLSGAVVMAAAIAIELVGIALEKR
jgi:hypothetical protein